MRTVLYFFECFLRANKLLTYPKLTRDYHKKYTVVLEHSTGSINKRFHIKSFVVVYVCFCVFFVYLFHVFELLHTCDEISIHFCLRRQKEGLKTAYPTPIPWASHIAVSMLIRHDTLYPINIRRDMEMVE